MEIIATHVSSDFDAFAGMVAAKKLYPEAEILLPSSINQNVRRFILLHEDALPALNDLKDINLDSVKKIIVIDTKIASRLGPLKKIIDKGKVEVTVYDHHQDSPEDIGYGTCNTKIIGATTAILVNLIKKRKIYITPLESTLFLLGIYEDTGSFIFPNTSPEDYEAAAFLKKQGANLFVISRFLNPPLTDQQHELLEKLIAGVKKINIHEKKVVLSSARTTEFIEGLSIITRKLAQIEDIDIVICWVKMKDKTYVVARSDDTNVDVSKILEVVGGGGHSQAASSVIKDAGSGEIENKLVSSLYKNIKKPMLAKDIMSFPIKVVNEDESINKVNELLKKYGHTGIPIVDAKNSLVGIITRKDVDRAIKHGLSHAPVKGFKSRGLVTTGPNTTIEEVQRMMIENGIGRIPIVQKGEVKGIVTRKDILRFLHGRDYPDHSRRPGTVRDFDISAMEMKDRLNRFLPQKIIKTLKITSDIAKNMKVPAYLVGGIVRDLLLGIPNLDIDIVVEGDGIIFARKLGELIGARIESYEKFKTAVLVLGGQQHIDIASARVEYYEKPAALPDIEPGNISQDLARRDFTINTLALSLNARNFGQVIDFFGGKKDLAAKKIKVLHKMSFIEDPTRIFRAVRFEQRLSFRMDKQTERLAISSIKMNIVSELNGIRIRDELISILGEKEPWKAVRRLYDLDALNKTGINIRSIEPVIAQLKKVIKKYKALSIHIGQNFRMWRMLVASMLMGKDRQYIEKWCFRMKIKKKDCLVIKETVAGFKELKRKISKRINRNSILFDLLKNKPEELMVLLSTESKNHYDNILRFYKKVLKTRLFITGNDLRSMKFIPSKNYSYALGEILRMKLDGHVKTREQEIKIAVKILGELEKKGSI